MQASQRTNIVQLDVTIGHISTLLKMVEHIRHVMIAEHVRDIAVLIEVQLMLVLRFYHDLSNRRTHPPIHPLHNLLIDRKSTRLNSSHYSRSRMPSSA